MEEKGFTIFDAPYFIDAVIESMIEGRLLEQEGEVEDGDFL